MVAENQAGYFGVSHEQPGRPKPYQARVKRGGKRVGLGCFATAEEAALCVARSPEGQAAVKAVPLTSKEARQQARAGGGCPNPSPSPNPNPNPNPSPSPSPNSNPKPNPSPDPN